MISYGIQGFPLPPEGLLRTISEARNRVLTQTERDLIAQGLYSAPGMIVKDLEFSYYIRVHSPIYRWKEPISYHIALTPRPWWRKGYTFLKTYRNEDGTWRRLEVLE